MAKESSTTTKKTRSAKKTASKAAPKTTNKSQTTKSAARAVKTKKPQGPTLTQRLKKAGPNRVLQTTHYAIWSLIGLALLVGGIVAFVNDSSVTETLKLTPSTDTATTSTPQPGQAPNQPSEAQLQCVNEEVGDARYDELRQGAQPTQEEAAVIQNCLQQ